MRRAGAMLLLAALAAAPRARAQGFDPLAVRTEADAAWAAGDYAKAATLYERLAAAGVRNQDVYYNLGTARLQSGRRGEAILAFERALRLAPGDADVAWNLAEAAKGNIDKLVGAREEEPFLERLGARVPVRAAGWGFLALWVAGVGALALRGLVRRGRGWLAGLGLAATLLSLAPAGMLFAAWRRARVEYAVVVAPATGVREGPARDFKAAFEVHEGLKVRVVAREQGFLRVRLPNGLEGWVAETDVPVI